VSHTFDIDAEREERLDIAHRLYQALIARTLTGRSRCAMAKGRWWLATTRAPRSVIQRLPHSDMRSRYSGLIQVGNYVYPTRRNPLSLASYSAVGGPPL
jgi:hypothetical protein